MTHTETLYKLLEGLGEVPEGLHFYNIYSDLPGRPDQIAGHAWKLQLASSPADRSWIEDKHALDILCNKARRVCDEHGVSFGVHHKDKSLYQATANNGILCDWVAYELALIAGLTHIKESRNG